MRLLCVHLLSLNEHFALLLKLLLKLFDSVLQCPDLGGAYFIFSKQNNEPQALCLQTLRILGLSNALHLHGLRFDVVIADILNVVVILSERIDSFNGVHLRENAYK